MKKVDLLIEKAKNYLKNGVDLTVFDLKTITIKDLEQLVLDTYNDTYNENLILFRVSETELCECEEPFIGVVAEECSGCGMLTKVEA